MKRWELAILIGLLLSIFTNSITGFAQQCGEVRASTVRLHILAASDTEEDQALKLMVRDAVLREEGAIFADAQNREDALRCAQSLIPRIEETARRVLQEQGRNMNVRAEVVNMYFETRHYPEEGVVMPAGRYDAVRILLGDGVGRNWWCVMFPPLCLPAAENPTPDQQAAQERVRQAAADGALIADQPKYEMKLAVVEAYESIKELFAKDGTQESPSA